MNPSNDLPSTSHAYSLSFAVNEALILQKEQMQAQNFGSETIWLQPPDCKAKYSNKSNTQEAHRELTQASLAY